ncbi:MAG: hypothetical protein EB829_02400 [Nitrosopumilus sp. H8]|nr:MAG: hypothetical protein EB829_02400 [Nitrosopumilus sp. H8]
MNPSLYLTLFAVVVAGFLVPAHAQLSDHVVINEVETNPPGIDAKSISEWVELYNPTDSSVDLKGWKIVSTSSKKALELPAGTILMPGQAGIFSYKPLWFANLGESVELRFNNGTVIDKTPYLTDQNDNYLTWQRLYDGYAPNSIDDWKFVSTSAGSSNGKLIESQEVAPISVSVRVEKSSYLFGETAIIMGNVSEKIFTVQPTFRPALVIISITGPSFEKEITLYPDTELNFKTSLNLQKVLGVGKGNYDISVTYSDATASADFAVGDKIFKPEVVKETVFTVTTDKPSYTPGQTVSMTATTNKIIPSAVLQFEAVDPNGKVIENGNLFSTDGKFSTSIFLTTVNPVYGTYEIKATFAEQSTTTTFKVSNAIKSGSAISLTTNQTAYGVGDAISVMGSVNNAWVGTLDLSINQVKVLGADNTKGLQVGTIIPVDGDGSFEYTFDVSSDINGLGDYLFRVSGDVGTADILISVVEDPANYVRSTEPLTIILDAASYEIGQTVAIHGQVLDPTDRATGVIDPISIYISKAGVGPLQITNLSPQDNDNVGTKADYFVTAIPEFTGSYRTVLEITPNIFDAGSYVLAAKYSDHTARATFTVSDPLDLGEKAISIDKDVYGLGQTVMLTGILPSTAATHVDIKLTRPEGSTATFAAPIEVQRIAWTWDVPDTEQSNSAIIGSAGDSKTSNLGIYEILVSFDSKETVLRFKVSLNPEDDSLSAQGLTVSTDKETYKTGDRLLVTGSVGPAKSSLETAIQRVTLYIYQLSPYDPIQVHTSNVFPKIDGSFSSAFELPASLFSDGTYGVSANYQGDKAVSAFVVGFETDSFLVSADNGEYLPGSSIAVTGTGGPDSGRLEISVIRESGSDAICGPSICGSVLGTKKIIPIRSGSFEYMLNLPDSVPFGKYEVVVASGTLVKSIPFDVVEELTIIEKAKSSTVIEKENRITDRDIVITTEKKTTDDGSLSPRVVSGSMIVNRGDEADVNLMISTESGTCVIGPGDGCLVSESTRKPGEIYDVVNVDGMSLNVRYSGPDVRLEKFSIIPESADEFLPDMDWNVSIVKDEQISRFYYKVTYKTIP